MKYIRYLFNNVIYTGHLDGDKVIEIINFSFEDSNYVFGMELPFSEVKILQPVVPVSDTHLTLPTKRIV